MFLWVLMGASSEPLSGRIQDCMRVQMEAKRGSVILSSRKETKE